MPYIKSNIKYFNIYYKGFCVDMQTTVRMAFCVLRTQIHYH